MTELYSVARPGRITLTATAAVLLILFLVVSCGSPDGLSSSPPSAQVPGLADTSVITPSPTGRSAPSEDDQLVTQPVPPTAEPTITVVATAMPKPTYVNQPQNGFQQMADLWQSELAVIDMSNTGLVQFAEGSFLHPIAVEIINGFLYMIDAGRVLEVNLENLAEGTQPLLLPNDTIEGVRVLEPLDLTIDGNDLIVLDRSGDVYRFNFDEAIWHLERYDRTDGESSGHYYVALDADGLVDRGDATRALLETNYKFVRLYDQENEKAWRLPEERAVDLVYQVGDTYVLQRELHDQAGHVSKYRDTSEDIAFRLRFPIEQPRQLIAAPEGIYVLDLDGSRLLLFDSQTGQLQRIIQLPQEQPISAVAYRGDPGRLILAGKDQLYFVGDPEVTAVVGVSDLADKLASHDRAVLQALDDFTVPIGGSNITFRDFQLPGAPRHYRLGVHYGLDFYWQPGTKVLSAGDGIAIRVDTDYIEPTSAELAAWRQATQDRGYSTPEILDHYLGRQVWIEHDPGVVTRYAHLRSIEPGLAVGDSVSRGQAIGDVGNSGSPASLDGETSDAHLHVELWINDSYLGQYLRPIETRDWVEKIFPVSR